MEKIGEIKRVNGSLIIAEGLEGVRIGDIAYVGDLRLIGEVVRISGREVALQCYEDTSGLRPGEHVVSAGMPLVAELGPGLIGGIFDGLERSEIELWKRTGPFIKKGYRVIPLNREKRWHFKPRVKPGDKVLEGDIIGVVKESKIIEHRILVPIGINGVVENIEEGDFKVDEPVAEIKLPNGVKREIKLMQTWPIRVPRPYKERLPLAQPLFTGQRVIDTFFPIAKGGTAAIPGGFGTGKCVPPGTPILLATGEIVAIEELFKRYVGKVVSDEALIPVSGLKIFSFDGERISVKDVKYLYKGVSKKLIRIRTRSGRTLEVTPKHRLYKLSPYAEIIETPAESLRIGDYLLMPRKISLRAGYQPIPLHMVKEFRIRDRETLEFIKECLEVVGKKFKSLKRLSKLLGVNYDVLIRYKAGRSRPTVDFLLTISRLAGVKSKRPRIIGLMRGKTSIKLPEVVDERLSELIGLILSDGMLTKKTVRFFNNDEKLRRRFSKLIKEVFGLESVEKRFRTVYGVEVVSSALSRLLQAMGLPLRKKSRNALVPPIILKSPDDVIAAFLRGYYLGDGTFSKGVIEVGSASKQMIHGLSYLLTRLGIMYTVNESRSRLIISGLKELRRFVETICRSDVSHAKLEAVAKYVESTKPNRLERDSVSLNSRFLKQAFIGIHRELRKSGINWRNYVHLRERIGASMIQRISQIIQIHGGGDCVSERLVKLSNILEYVFFDRITDIQVIEGDFTVYDLTVPETHNFVGGEIPSIYHNTVTLQSIAKWSDADIIIYVGCGERGNEMADILTHFPELEDPRTGEKLIERAIFIANVSNLPVSAREASIYVGITMAEYYRDQGYDVGIIVDSTSRWAEALRDLSGRLEELPAEEGYPAYLAERIAKFYERAGRVVTLGSERRIGSVTIMGAVSPPGGDFSEPVTSTTMRFVGALWALDTELAFRRHFPAINWLRSFSRYVDLLKEFWEKYDPNWLRFREEALRLLEESSRLEEIARVIGEKALPDEQRLILLVSEILREGFLVQSAFHEVDRYCPPEKQAKILRVIVEFYNRASELVRLGAPVERIRGLKNLVELLRLKERKELDEIDEAEKRLVEEMEALKAEYSR